MRAVVYGLALYMGTFLTWPKYSKDESNLSHSSKRVITVINASAAVTLLEQRPEKNSGSEWDSNPRPLRCRYSALPTELSKPHESGRIRVSPLYTVYFSLFKSKHGGLSTSG